MSHKPKSSQNAAKPPAASHVSPSPSGGSGKPPAQPSTSKASSSAGDSSKSSSSAPSLSSSQAELAARLSSISPAEQAYINDIMTQMAKSGMKLGDREIQEIINTVLMASYTSQQKLPTPSTTANEKPKSKPSQSTAKSAAGTPSSAASKPPSNPTTSSGQLPKPAAKQAAATGVARQAVSGAQPVNKSSPGLSTAKSVTPLSKPLTSPSSQPKPVVKAPSVKAVTAGSPQQQQPKQKESLLKQAASAKSSKAAPTTLSPFASPATSVAGLQQGTVQAKAVPSTSAVSSLTASPASTPLVKKSQSPLTKTTNQQPMLTTQPMIQQPLLSVPSVSPTTTNVMGPGKSKSPAIPKSQPTSNTAEKAKSIQPQSVTLSPHGQTSPRNVVNKTPSSTATANNKPQGQAVTAATKTPGPAITAANIPTATSVPVTKPVSTPFSQTSNSSPAGQIRSAITPVTTSAGNAGGLPLTTVNSSQGVAGSRPLSLTTAVTAHSQPMTSPQAPRRPSAADSPAALNLSASSNTVKAPLPAYSTMQQQVPKPSVNQPVASPRQAVNQAASSPKQAVNQAAPSPKQAAVSQVVSSPKQAVNKPVSAKRKSFDSGNTAVSSAPRQALVTGPASMQATSPLAAVPKPTAVTVSSVVTQQVLQPPTTASSFAPKIVQATPSQLSHQQLSSLSSPPMSAVVTTAGVSVTAVSAGSVSLPQLPLPQPQLTTGKSLGLPASTAAVPAAVAARKESTNSTDDLWSLLEGASASLPNQQASATPQNFNKVKTLRIE